MQVLDVESICALVYSLRKLSVEWSLVRLWVDGGGNRGCEVE